MKPEMQVIREIGNKLDSSLHVSGADEAEVKLTARLSLGKLDVVALKFIYDALASEIETPDIMQVIIDAQWLLVSLARFSEKDKVAEFEAIFPRGDEFEDDGVMSAHILDVLVEEHGEADAFHILENARWFLALIAAVNYYQFEFYPTWRGSKDDWKPTWSAGQSDRGLIKHWLEKER